ncbi:MAG: TniQ family protein, partial [Rhizobium pusense]|nr:TniQ family protein [Agrobacterium pusense]
MALPITVEFHETETPLSLASRLAHANGYRSMRAFLATTDTNATAISSGHPEAMALLAHWSGVEEARLAAYAIASVTAAATWKLGHALMGRDMRPARNHRYCPKCVVDDLENGSGRPFSRPYVRATWMTRALQNCPKHSCAIKEVPVSAQEQGDFALFVAKNVSAITEEAINASVASSVQIDPYVLARIEGIAANEFLDNFETYVAVDLCRHFGRFQKMHQIAYDRCDLAFHSDVECGFGSASAGRNVIERIICQAIDQSKPIVYEMASFFGPLRDWLQRNHKKPEFSLVTEIFQDIAERNLPIGPNEAFVLPTRKRHLHSIRSAGLEYGMMEDRIQDLLLEANLIAPSQLTSAKIYFDASRGHAVLSEALDTMTSAEIRTALGITDDRMRAILDAGLLRRVEQPKDGVRVFSRVQRSEF